MKQSMSAAMAAVALLLALCAVPCHGVLTLSLSSPSNLLDLTVGDPVRVEVSLSGLDEAAGDQLVSLTGGTTVVPSAIMGTPTAIDPGAIVPNLADFAALVGLGQADAFFVTLSASSSASSGDHITTNGTFFTFDMIARHPGTGVISLDPLALQAEQFDPDPNAVLPILRDVEAGTDLPFRVSVIPEPLTAALGIFGLGSLACWSVCCR